jgi:hypothetical protein
VVGKTRVLDCCDQSCLIRCEIPPVYSLGVIGVHRSACLYEEIEKEVQRVMVSIEGLFKSADDFSNPVPKDRLISNVVSSQTPDHLLHLLYSLPQGRYGPTDVAYMAMFPTRFILKGSDSRKC